MAEQHGQLKKLQISSVIEEVPGFKTIVFAAGHDITYKAGQYLTLVHHQNGMEVRRSYSITSTPVRHEPLSIGVKRIANGVFSRLLTDSIKPGDTLLTTGSGGLFVLPENSKQYKQLFFFAAGSGITPIFSLLKTALHVFPQLSLVLVYSNTAPHTAIFLPTLQALQQQFPERFHLELLFSNTFNLLRARLHRNLIFEFLDRFVTPEQDRTLFYICGPESYMRLCTYTLQESGIAAQNIKRENFLIHTAPKSSVLPPDTALHVVRIRMGTAIHDVAVHYPDTILKAAKKAGIVLPYSCEVGRCGNCVATCIRGTVWHSYNEILTEADLHKGLVLTCVGHPVGGDAELRM
jgi:ring-1,2-phenylacetyl-CoA epoxidase subunit PaaE